MLLIFRNLLQSILSIKFLLKQLSIKIRQIIDFLLSNLTTDQGHRIQSFFTTYLVLSQSRNSPHFMNPEGSLPHLQLPATVPILSQINPVHRPTSHFLKIYFNITLSSTPGFSKWYISLRFPHQNPVYASPLPHTCYMLCLSDSSLFDQPKNIWSAVQNIKLLIL